ncbi:MAG: hypothetical protein HYV46_15965 [candidate division NC10 bacterium]|nr:hypothetical protein [candidate division NC10 bacterium]
MRKRPPDSTPISPYRAAQERLTEEMWRLNRTRLLRGEAQVDPFLDRMEEDQRRCLTLLARIPPTLHPALLDVQARLLRAGPAFAYPPSSFHFTIRGIYDYGKYTRVDADIRAIGEILSRLIDDLSPFAVHFRGVNCNRSAVFVQGFYDAPTLGMFRLAMGEALAAFRVAPLPTLDVDIDFAWVKFTSWSCPRLTSSACPIRPCASARSRPDQAKCCGTQIR